MVRTLLIPGSDDSRPAKPFNIEETTIENIQNALDSGQLTSEELVKMYLDRIQAIDKDGPQLNSIISINPYDSALFLESIRLIQPPIKVLEEDILITPI
jgi:amidase